MPNFIDPADFEALKRDDALPSPSGVRLNIMRMCRQEDVSLVELVTQIQADPVLGGRIIKIGNGASVNKGRPIVAISKDVLLMIGLDAVRQLALAISLTTERRDSSCAGFDYAAFWARTVAMACAAQALAEYYGEAPPTEMFASGLLANIGSLGLAAARPEDYAGVLASVTDDDGSDAKLRDAEQAAFGYTHLDLAAAMMQDWSIRACSAKRCCITRRRRSRDLTMSRASCGWRRCCTSPAPSPIIAWRLKTHAYRPCRPYSMPGNRSTARSTMWARCATGSAATGWNGVRWWALQRKHCRRRATCWRSCANNRGNRQSQLREQLQSSLVGR